MDNKSEILQRFFDGDFSTKDYAEVKSLFADETNHTFLRDHMAQNWNQFEPQDSSNAERLPLLSKIHLLILNMNNN